MCGNGSKIAGTGITMVHLQMGDLGKKRMVVNAASACSAAVPLAADRGTCARLSGTGPSPASVAAPLAFVLPRMFLNSLFFYSARDPRRFLEQQTEEVARV